MRAPVVAAFLLLLVGVLAGAATEARAESGASVDERTAAIASELRCPVCQNLSVADSPSDVAASFRERIRELVLAGRSDAQVRAFFVERYGEWILLSPPRRGIGLAVWLAPVALLLGGLLVVVIAVRRWSSRARRLAAVAADDPEAMAHARARLDALERETSAS